MAENQNAPGLVVALSGGTDSILSFLVCAKAFQDLGRPQDVSAIHYGAPFPPPDKTPEELDRILRISPGFNRVARTILPWLQTHPYAAGTCITIEAARSDPQRWAGLYERAIELGHWIAGTRNASEAMLKTYSTISGIAGVQPILPLWKSEVLQLCEWLGVPQSAMESSRLPDCLCGRDELAASHIEAIDAILMTRAGTLDPAYLDRAIPMPTLRAQLEDYVDTRMREGAFKAMIPHCPTRAMAQAGPA